MCLLEGLWVFVLVHRGCDKAYGVDYTTCTVYIARFIGFLGTRVFFFAVWSSLLLGRLKTSQADR